jgi:hypothetical protein
LNIGSPFGEIAPGLPPMEFRMATIELTGEQRSALYESANGSVEVVDPATGKVYELRAVERPAIPSDSPAEENYRGIPPGVLTAMQAYWRELDQLLAVRKNRGKWVLFHLDKQIAIAKTPGELHRLADENRFPIGTTFVERIEPQAFTPWDPEDMDTSAFL